jgi:hypothetical protein
MGGWINALGRWIDMWIDEWVDRWLVGG